MKINNVTYKKIVIFSMVIASYFFVTSITVQAVYQDREISENNTVSASNLDAVLIGSENKFEPEDIVGRMLPGDSVDKSITIKNVGNLDLKYRVAFIENDEENSLCDELQLEAVKEGDLKYSGPLSEFEYSLEELNSANNSDDWIFTIDLPEDLFIKGKCDFKFSFTSWQLGFGEPDYGWVDVEESSNDIIIAGLKVPIQTGYNVKNSEEDDEATPQYPNDNELRCAKKPEDAEVTNINDISVHWTDVSDGDSSIKYQRRYSKVGDYTLDSNHFDPIYENHYTNYRKFSTLTGVDGIYGSQVRAWLDKNEDGLVQDNEVSDWSNKCYVRFDGTPPTPPTGLRRLKRADHDVVYECGDTITIQGVHPDWDDNPEEDGVDHYEYTSFNAPNGKIGLDEKIMKKSIFEYNGSWLPKEGTYGFIVRAVDKAGNKSAWSGKNIDSNKTLEDSCQINYTKPNRQSVKIKAGEDEESEGGDKDKKIDDLRNSQGDEKTVD